ncbi:42805_t:CDS:2, partial [Gigaspora margarita]
MYFNQSQEKFEQKVKELKHKNSNMSNLDIYLEIAKNNPNLKIEAKYQIALHYKKYKEYNNALKNAKEIPKDYKNIKMLKAKCYIKIGDEESALKLYEEIANNNIKDSEENKKFNKKVNHLKMTNKIRNNLEIWQQIAKYKDKNLSVIAKKKINEHKNIRRRKLQLYGKNLNNGELYKSIYTSIVTYDLLESLDENINNCEINNLN